VGPELWALEPFCGETGALDADGVPARAFRATLGLEDL